MDNAKLSLFISRIQAICTEMGVVLQHSAISPNIRDRLDFSCAIFDAAGRLSAQASHIPVHLGSMAYAMQDFVSTINWSPGDTVITNNPFYGGTHLPDVTLITPVFVNNILYGFIANRAHHADIGSSQPGSMPLSESIHAEGLLIEPTHIMKNFALLDAELDKLCEQLRTPAHGRADIHAQLSANTNGVEQLTRLIKRYGEADYLVGLNNMNDYAGRLALSTIKQLPTGQWTYQDYMDDDGMGNTDIPIKVNIQTKPDHITVDFSGSADQARGNINCPVSVTAAAVYYCFHCLMPNTMPICAGSLDNITLHVPKGCLLNAQYPAAVAAGNVETSTRIVDVILGALKQCIPTQIPAASHGSMNNIAMGMDDWDYYETIGGGMGASNYAAGQSAVQTHMTNTLNTPVEVVESRYPVRISRYAIRKNSGGDGLFQGGNGIIREFEFTENTMVSLLTERRNLSPWGVAGGQDGVPGVNELNGQAIAAKTTLQVGNGDKLAIYTPGGGGHGEAADASPGD